MKALLSPFTLCSSTGFKVEIMPFGGIITKIFAKNRNGFRDNVVLHYDVPEDYLDNPPFLGCAVGPVSGRTFEGQLKLSSRTQQLDTSLHPHALHSGKEGLHLAEWEVASVDENTLTLKHTSHCGTGVQNYTLTYTAIDESLHLDYNVICSEESYFSLTNHSYFNLTGEQGKTIAGHSLQLNCSHVALLNANSLPTHLVTLDESPFDFSSERLISQVLESDSKGVDHPFKCEGKQPIATLKEPTSGRKMEVYTTQPYVVIYSGNYLASSTSTSGKTFVQHEGICFETQDLPNITLSKLDAVHFSTPDCPYQHRTTFSFATF